MQKKVRGVIKQARDNRKPTIEISKQGNRTQNRVIRAGGKEENRAVWAIGNEIGNKEENRAV